MRLWTDGSYSVDVPARYQQHRLPKGLVRGDRAGSAGGGAVAWLDDGRCVTHAAALRALNSGQAEIEAVKSALAAIDADEPVWLLTDCTTVLVARARGMLTDDRLVDVAICERYVPELRLAHQLANWARRGDRGPRPCVAWHRELRELAAVLALRDAR